MCSGAASLDLALELLEEADLASTRPAIVPGVDLWVELTQTDRQTDRHSRRPKVLDGVS